MSLSSLLTKGEPQTMMTRGICEKEDRFGGIEVSIQQVGTQLFQIQTDVLVTS